MKSDVMRLITALVMAWLGCLLLAQPTLAQQRRTQTAAHLGIPTDIAATAGASVTVPVSFQSGGNAVASTAFVLDYDESCLDYQSVHFNTPVDFATSAADHSGKLDVTIVDYNLPFASLPDTDALLTVLFTVKCNPGVGAGQTTTIRFDPTTGVTFGDVHGRDVAGSASDGALRIAGVATKPVTLALYPGWNLLAIPVVPNATTPAAVLAPLAGNYNLVYAYNTANSANPWQKYNPNGPAFGNTLTRINPSQGLWVRVTNTASLPVTGADPATTAIPLATGWNLIAYPVDSPATPIATALAGIAGKYNLVYAYNAANPTSPWQKYNPTGPTFANTLTELKPGIGYWIRATTDTTLTVN